MLARQAHRRVMSWFTVIPAVSSNPPSQNFNINVHVLSIMSSRNAWSLTIIYLNCFVYGMETSSEAILVLHRQSLLRAAYYRLARELGAVLARPDPCITALAAEFMTMCDGNRKQGVETPVDFKQLERESTERLISHNKTEILN